MRDLDYVAVPHQGPPTRWEAQFRRRPHVEVIDLMGTVSNQRSASASSSPAEKAPSVTLYPEAERRVRWLNKEEATRLLDASPTHQKRLTRFALATGLRQVNVLGLKWSDVDMNRRTAWVHADEAKGGEAIGVPLNDQAVAVLREDLGSIRSASSRPRAGRWGRPTRGPGGMHSSAPA